MNMSAVILAEGGHRGVVVHEAPWEWVLVFGILVAYTLYELWAGRKAEDPSPLKAALRLGLSLMIAAAFGVFIFMRHGSGAALEYTNGFFVEYGLSLDNLAVWAQVLIAFVFFKGYHRKLLMYGVLMSIVLRILFIVAGVELVQRFAIVTILMGIFLIITAKKLVADVDDEEFRIEENSAYKIITRIVPFTPERYGAAFVTRQAGGRLGFKFTPLGIGFLVFGFVDVMFAVDSVPAILSIASDPYTIVSSNAMALLGLMSAYFLLDSFKDKISKLNEGLALILLGVGIKMLLGSHLFWDLVWNGYVISWTVVVAITGALLAGWAYTRIHTRTWAVPKFTLYTATFLVVLKFYAGWEAFSAIRRDVWHPHEVHIPPLWTLIGILVILLGAYLWGRMWPEESNRPAPRRWNLDRTGKIQELVPVRVA